MTKVFSPAKKKGRVSGLSEDLRERATTHPAEVVANPDCPPDLWRQLIQKYPMEGLSNPAALLYGLEDPALSLEALEMELAAKWITATMPKLSEKEQRLFAADCAEHVLRFFEAKYPGDDRPRKAIKAARDYANGKISSAALRQAAADAVESSADANADAYTAESSADANAAARAAESAANAAYVNVAQAAADDAANAAYVNVAADLGEATFQERIWQWRRLLEYLNGTANQVATRSIQHEIGRYELPALGPSNDRLTEQEIEQYAALYWVHPDLILRNDAYATTWGLILLEQPELVEDGREVQHIYPGIAIDTIARADAMGQYNEEAIRDLAHDIAYEVACELADEALRLGSENSPAIRKAIKGQRACDMSSDEMRHVYDTSYTIGSRAAHAAIGAAYGLHGNGFNADAIEECVRDFFEEGEPSSLEDQLIQWLKHRLYALAMRGMS